jgi:hypothetical protein
MNVFMYKSVHVSLRCLQAEHIFLICLFDTRRSQIQSMAIQAEGSSHAYVQGLHTRLHWNIHALCRSEQARKELRANAVRFRTEDVNHTNWM